MTTIKLEAVDCPEIKERMKELGILEVTEYTMQNHNCDSCIAGKKRKARLKP